MFRTRDTLPQAFLHQNARMLSSPVTAPHSWLFVEQAKLMAVVCDECGQESAEGIPAILAHSQVDVTFALHPDVTLSFLQQVCAGTAPRGGLRSTENRWERVARAPAG